MACGDAPAAPAGGEAAFTIIGSTFKRSNPKSDRFEMIRYDHLEFYVADATAASRRFRAALGMNLLAKSDLVTGNTVYASYVLGQGDIRFVFTAPLVSRQPETPPTAVTFPQYSVDAAHTFIRKHSFGVRAIGILVADAAEAYTKAVANGLEGVTPPYEVSACGGPGLVISEVVYAEDTLMRFVQRNAGFTGAFAPGYVDEPAGAHPAPGMGLTRVDHVVLNCLSLAAVVPRLERGLGLHRFAEFVAADVGTLESGLNSAVLANNTEMLLFPINEPTPGVRVSQIQTFCDQYEGAGVQHIALKTDDIFATMRAMMAHSATSGVEFQKPPNARYYQQLRERMAEDLTEEQFRMAEEMGVLGDKDPEGALLQIFTKPVTDRPTVFFEIIQRVGCMLSPTEQKPGCGGFGKGNFSELFRSIEDYERDMEKARDEALKASSAVTIKRLA